MRRLRGGLLGVVVGIAATLVAPALGSDRSVDWSTYGMNNQRTGFNPTENGLGPSVVGSIRQIWSTRLGATILTQPVVASGVVVRHPRRSVDLVYAATEHGVFAAMDANTGRVVWSRRLGFQHVSFCGDLPDHDFGITGTPVIDHGGHSIYTTGGDGRLYELDLATGRTKRHWVMTHDPAHENDYGALTLVNGILYVPYSGNCDINPYHGFVAAFRVRDGRRIATWFPSGSLFGGSIWGFGGVSADPGGAIFAAVGNSQGSNEHAGYGENVVKLTPGLGVINANYPGLPKGDADFGATPLLFQRPGCPPELAVGNKYGSFYVYERDRISSGPVQQIGLGGSGFGQNGLLGVAAYWPRAAMVYVSNPLNRGPYRHGLVAFRVTGGCRLSLAWSASDGHNGDASSPTVAAGVVFYGDGSGHQAIAMDARTGRRLWDSGRAIRGSVYAGPTVVNGKVYVSSVGGYLYAFAPAPQTISPPAISGTATQNRTLTESHGSWTNDPKRYIYQWEDCNSSGRGCAAIGGATRRKFTLTSADVGHTIRVQETATNASGASSPAISAATRVVSPLPPSNTAPPSISGITTQGQILPESHGSWTNYPTSFTYQWERCDRSGRTCSAIAGATSRTYTLTAADVGDTIRVQETASNTHRSRRPAISAPTGVILPSTAPPTQPSIGPLPVISGATTAGQTLTGLPGAWSGTPPVSFGYQWERCTGSCAPIAGATSSSYTLTRTDVRAKIALVVTATNSAGSAHATSAQVGPVTSAGPTPHQVKAALVKALKRSAKASIRQLLGNDADTLAFSAPSPGRLAISWYLVQKGHHRPKATQRLRVAAANVIIRRPGTLKVRITLTGSGRRVLERSSHLKLAANATFTPAGGTTTNATMSITLRK